jgi:hypothetical protein
MPTRQMKNTEPPGCGLSRGFRQQLPRGQCCLLIERTKAAMIHSLL